MAILKQWMSEGILTPGVFQRLSLFLDLLEEWNARVNLTGLRTRSEMEEVLIAESIAAVLVFPMSGKTVLDVGSGAGIPGMVWVIMDSTIRLTSLEIRGKKVAFQKEVQRFLSLDSEIIKGRFPEAVAARSFDVIATRAVRYSPALERQAESLTRKGGYLLRFVAPATVESGWETRPLSSRSTLLLRQI